MVYTAEKTKTDLKDKLNADHIGKIDAAVANLKDALAKGDMAVVKTKSEELGKVLQDIGTMIYQQAAAAEQAKQQSQATQTGPEQPQQDQGGQSGSSEGEKVVDSEDYKVK
jgi:molecular chaperone DnaK